MIAPRPSPDDSPPKPGFPMRPFWGIQPELLSKKVVFSKSTSSLDNERANMVCLFQNEIPVSGHLCIKKPWPGQARTIWKNHSKFLSMYYKPYPGKKNDGFFEY